MATAGEMTGECIGGKDQRDAILTLKTIGIVLRVALYSRSPGIRPPKSPETRPVCRFTVAMLRCSDAVADETRPACCDPPHVT